MPRPKLNKTEETIALSIRVRKSLRDKIKDHADLNNRSMAQEVVYLVGIALDYLEKFPDPKHK